VSEVGYTWDEVILPLQVFQESGFKVDFATPNGKEAQPDPVGVKSYPLLHLMGYGTRQQRGPSSMAGKALLRQLTDPIHLSKASGADYDALFIAGGHGALFDLHNHTGLQKLIETFYKQGKVIGALCHSSSILCEINIDGENLASRHRLTGFPTALEHFILAARMIHHRFLPMPLWTGRQLNKNTRQRPLWFRVYEVLNVFTTVPDGQLVTGVGPKSSRGVANQMTKLMMAT